MSKSKPVFIICLNWQEYTDFMDNHPYRLGRKTNIIYIGDCQPGCTPVVIRGISDPAGYFYGKWYLRDDFHNIFLQLKMQTDDKSRTKRLNEIYELGMQKRREHGKN